jgi:hypothetical protein
VLRCCQTARRKDEKKSLWKKRGKRKTFAGVAMAGAAAGFFFFSEFFPWPKLLKLLLNVLQH